MMRREKLEHLVTTGMTVGKLSTRKQREKMLDGLTKLLKIKRVTELEALKAKTHRDEWKVMIVRAKEHDI